MNCQAKCGYPDQVVLERDLDEGAQIYQYS